MNKALLAKLIKTSSGGSALSQLGKRDYASTGIPILDLVLSGKLHGGLSHGWNFFAAPSKHFKTALLLMAIAGWQKKHPNGTVIFYDSESGSDDLTYFKNFGVNIDNVLHVPVYNIEDWTADFAQKLEAISKGDEVMVAIDSVGNTPSKKEIANALTNSDKQDMTRAKALKSMTRIVTPHINAKEIPVVAVNHVYETQEMYSKTIMSGGTGPMLSANNVVFITRSQIKEKVGKKDELAGYQFTLVIDKSRKIREKSKFPLTVTYDGGIYKYSSIFEHALKYGYITSPKKGWYEYKGKKMRRAAIAAEDSIFEEILEDPDFCLLVEGSYTLDHELREAARALALTRNINIEEEVEAVDEEDEDAQELRELMED